MEPQDIHTIIAEMKYKNIITIRQKESLSWGNSPEVCKDLFMRIFCELDTTYDNPRYLPEYDEIVDWMINTKDKGLLLMGDCGRGKSIIITGVIPVLMRLKGRNVKPIMAHELNRTVCYDSYFTNPPEGYTYLDYATSQFARNIIVDEVGTETMNNDYGERIEPFNLIMNVAEQYHRRLFLSTNLTEQEILDRYGMRTLDRLSHLCRIVRFKGESLR